MASEDPSREMLPYERLLGDAMRGDASLFGRQDAIEAQCRAVVSSALRRHVTCTKRGSDPTAV